jgi:hypothetical protein
MAEADAPGVEIRASETLGMTGTSLCKAWFSGVELPA